jgi:hypothetical protein
MGQNRPLETVEPLSFVQGRRSCAAYPPQTQDRAATRFIPGNLPVAEKPPDFPVPRLIAALTKHRGLYAVKSIPREEFSQRRE